MVKKIISYNTNGIRAAVNKGFDQWLTEYSPDILCIQETKIQSGQINEEIYKEMGYDTYWYSAEKKGYSGTAVFTKIKPDSVYYGINIEKYDNEARLIRADYKDITLLCVYIPSGTMGGERQDFKMKFLEDFHAYIDNLKKTNKNIIISGYFNICHKPVDINHPEKHNKSSGFLPEEREWMENFFKSGFIDSFRVFNKEAGQYSWWSYRANSRAKNLGWRIDYNIISGSLRDKLKGAGILSNVYHSDHCPVYAEILF
jgi:exodeoxyribonuclease-3